MGVGREFVPRNAPEIFNRGDPAWFTMFWDGRVAADPYEGEMSTPAGRQLVDQIDTALAAQALFPPTSRDEMRGLESDRFAQGHENELSGPDDEDFLAIWDGVMDRLLAIPDYQALFAAAYPGVPTEELTMAHAANAIAAYEIVAFSFTHAPFDRYLAGDTTALTPEQKQGALLFFGRANCVACHNGPLLTDQRFYNLAIPQFGPGKDEETGLDLGRQGVTRDVDDRFAFRTPPLRNVTLTGPYMHNGAYASLEDAVRHHLDPAAALAAYDAGQLPAALQETLRNDVEMQEELVAALEQQLVDQQPLTDDEVALILAFLESLTDPAARDLSHLVPASVPSGLPVKD
jgi:cytochrome c peroxidase